MTEHPALILFLALFGLYSPVAALASYLALVRPYGRSQVMQLAVGPAFNGAAFVLVALRVGEPLLKLLGIGTAASAEASHLGDRLWPSLAAVAFAAVTGLTVYASGQVERRISIKGAMLLDRVAGILLTAIAAILLANGFTDLVTARLSR